METKFQRYRKQEGRFGIGRALCLGLTWGRFWTRLAGCHTIYKGQDGDFDYDSILAVMDIADDLVIVKWQDLPANTIWRYVRRRVSDCGLESDDGDPAALVRIDAQGDCLAAPNAPAQITALPVAGGKIRLAWRYATRDQAVDCDGFYIFIDSGAGLDFDNPDDEVAPACALTENVAAGEFKWTSDALNNGQSYSFCIRSFNATSGGQSRNTDFVAAVADAVGPAALADLRAAWEEI